MPTIFASENWWARYALPTPRLKEYGVDASTPKDLHFYEPKNGHGLKHDPFNAIIAPRPIGWISSRDARGNINLAPYSFFNGFCYTPPIVGFSSTSWKDSVANIQETSEFVWNLATMDLAKQMNATAAHVAHDVNEFSIAGLTPAPCKLVNVPASPKARSSSNAN